MAAIFRAGASFTQAYGQIADDRRNRTGKRDECPASDSLSQQRPCRGTDEYRARKTAADTSQYGEEDGQQHAAITDQLGVARFKLPPNHYNVAAYYLAARIEFDPVHIRERTHTHIAVELRFR